MKRYKKLSILPLLAGLILLGSVTPGEASVYFQCPGYVQGVSSDTNGDGILRGAEIGAAVPESQVCIHLSSGDGFVNMADKVLDPDGNGQGHLQYMFGFANVTGVPDSQVMNVGMLGAEFPAPTINVREGDDVYLSLTNVGMMMRPDLFDAHTVHWHGFPNASAIFDGLPDSGVAIGMGSTLTYYYKVAESGTFMYHCHVEAAEHMQMGMLGNLYVEAKQTYDGYAPNGIPAGRLGGNPDPSAPLGYAFNDQDGSTAYDVEFPVQISSFDPVFHDNHINVQPLPFADMEDTYPMINGRGYPDTINPAELGSSPENGFRNAQKIDARIIAAPGQRILLRITSLSTTSYHTLSIMGIPMKVVGNGSRKLGLANDTSKYYYTNSVTLGGGEAMEVILDTRGPDGIQGNADDIAPGTYFLYTTNLDHLANNEEDYGGMMTEIVIQ
ncbi:hypothetical protein DESUT3_37680 [Desulfuromonas versatilis]|uniref:Plastocyanin-like domain-containing protein n=1 Tax=Desulfuromonas versatilis TaxID=2802975 RepID=A0ABN6E4Q3_9BACT|nr:multicopper oxidase domain-containing protein [Desulfuromonas versatilis]BCR06699.1 hypothetical protein DESUT3_37680 [Desulfuromonas versatilis]